MATAAIYARFSTEGQRPTSIEDQVRRCREKAEQAGFTVADEMIFADRAVSGTAKGRTKRTAYLQMLDAIDARVVDVVFTDEVSRVARDYLDGAKLIDQVERTGFRIVTDDGVDSDEKGWKLLWSLKMMVAAQQTESTAGEVVRAMQGQLERGYQIAQTPIGYASMRIKAQDGRELGTSWRLDEDTAPIVSRMYSWRFAGRSFAKIAKALNDEGVPCPNHRRCKASTFWRPATVSRVLANPIYKGTFVWNGSPFSRAKAKRRRKALLTKSYERPSLRLVTDEVWAACNPPGREERIRGGGRHALSGVINCGVCKSKLSIGGGPKHFHVCCPGCEQAKRVNGPQDFIGYTSLSAVKVALNWALTQLFTGPLLADFRARLQSRLTEGPAKDVAVLEARVAELAAIRERLDRMLMDPRTPVDWLTEKVIEVNDALEGQKRQLKALRERSAGITREAVQLQAGIDPLPLLKNLLDGEPAAYKVRAVLKRLIRRFEFVERKKKGHSVFEVEFVPGAFVAEVSESAVIDETPVGFRIEVQTTAKRPVVWEVGGRSI
jgi:site-specific DNA recombinase